MAKIIAPNKKFSGKRAGVAFVDGVGTTDDESAVRYFTKHGYKVEGYEPKTPKPIPEAPKVEDPATDPYAGMSIEDLRKHAAENDIDLAGATRKDDIKAVIAAAVPVADGPQD